MAMDFHLNLSTEKIDHVEFGDPLCVEPETTAREVLELFKERSKAAALICRDGVLVGIFTERDALRLMADGDDLSVPIERLMVRDPVTLTRDNTVGEAIAKMSRGGYRRLPVVDEHGRPLGVQHVPHILHYLVDHFPAVIYTLPPTPNQATKEREGA